MASLVVPRTQLLRPVAGLLLAVTIATSLTAVADSARASSAPAPTTTAAKPIEVYPACSKTLMPKRCSLRLTNMIKTLAETKATIAGPNLAAAKLKTDSCVTECAKVVDEATSKATAAKADEEALKTLKGYLYDTAINNYGPIGPCECNCPEPCTADEAAAVKKLGDATGSMRNLGNELEDLLGRDKDVTSEGAKAAAAEMEKSVDSGVFHASCGLTKEPQKCADELAVLAETTSSASGDLNLLQRGLQESKVVKTPPALDSAIEECEMAIDSVNQEVYSTGRQVKNLAEIRDTLRSNVMEDGKKTPLCKYSCPPPPEKPCTANETAVVEKLAVVYNAWVAADKFLTELLPPGEGEAKGKDKEAPKKDA